MILHGLAARAVCAAVIGGSLLAAFFLVRALVLARASRSSPGLAQFRRGLPGIVYFTTPDCVTCRAAQRPALRALEERLDGRIQVIEVDAAHRPDLARQWSVLSVPTTFILDRNGRPRQVNHGFASTEKLLGQLERLAG